MWQALRLWYDRPAEKWLEALPVGNGRLGAMVFGGVREERVALNEDTFWSGGPRDTQNPEALAHLAEVRRLIREGRQGQAGAIADAHLFGVPKRMQAYMPLGDLRLHTDLPPGEAAGYRRELDLDAAVASVVHTAGGGRFTREVFASAPDQVIVLHLECDRPGGLSFGVGLDSPFPARLAAAAADVLALDGHWEEPAPPSDGKPRRGLRSPYEGEGLPFRIEVRAMVDGGSTAASPDGLRVTRATSATILLAAATGYGGADPAERCAHDLRAAARREYAELRDRHTADHRRLFRRVGLWLGGPDVPTPRDPQPGDPGTAGRDAGGGSTPRDRGAPGAGDRPGDEARTGDRPDARPTDVRMAALAADGAPPDLGLEAAFFQFGRYLLIASSRPGTQPANLQGIWNENPEPPWGSKWTININTEMNYWPAEVTGLAECHEPLFELVDSMRPSGRRTARVHYGCDGFVAHHNTDLWRMTTPVDGVGSGIWPTGAAWLSLHLWEHWRYSRDRAFLRRAYPILKEAATFLCDFLIEDASGHLVTSPSISPENRYTNAAGDKVSLCEGPTMDMQICRALFRAVAEAAEALGTDDGFAERATAAARRLSPPRIGGHGQLQEWAEDFDEPEPGHRHVSHLFGLYPGDEITPRGTPDLARAARVSLSRRLSHGGGHTGWSRAWVTALWARLAEGDLAREHYVALLSRQCAPNLMDLHPPGIFQIDGNLGATAAVAEMLLQSHTGEIEFLCALPSAWNSGSVTGLRARGGLQVDVAWSDGRLRRAVLRAAGAGTVRLRAPAGQSVASARAAEGGAAVEMERPEDGVAALALPGAGRYEVDFEPGA